jgi:hypothetical protein
VKSNCIVAHKYKWAIPFLRIINTEAWPSRLEVVHGAVNPIQQKTFCCEFIKKWRPRLLEQRVVVPKMVVVVMKV